MADVSCHRCVSGTDPAVWMPGGECTHSQHRRCSGAWHCSHLCSQPKCGASRCICQARGVETVAVYWRLVGQQDPSNHGIWKGDTTMASARSLGSVASAVWFMHSYSVAVQPFILTCICNVCAYAMSHNRSILQPARQHGLLLQHHHCCCVTV